MTTLNICRPCRLQLARNIGKSLGVRYQSTSSASSFEELRTSLPARKRVVLYSDLTPSNSHVLNVSLASYLPGSWLSKASNLSTPNRLPAPAQDNYLPPAHHLVYFNPSYPANVLLPDGTDPNQSPGLPFVRRMWAGGYIRFDTKRPIPLDGQRWACVEGIRDVQIKGKSGEEKVFVGIERRIGQVRSMTESEEELRERLWEENEESLGEAQIVERRNIVFMRKRSEEELRKVREQGAAPPVQKMLKPQHQPTFTHNLTPTSTLLFRYSALTFNAHAIHLDPHFCRDIEGHRNLLFHGPLSFTLMCNLLQAQISASSGKDVAVPAFEYLEYRNLAPLYAEEPVKLCGREVENGKYELWVETPEGGIAVRGMARVAT